MFRRNFRFLGQQQQQSESVESGTAQVFNDASKKGVTPGNSSEKSTETKPSQQQSSSSSSTKQQQQKQKLVLPKDEALRNEAALNHRFAKYMSYRDPNDRHLKVSRLVFERHKGKIGMVIGGGCVIAATVAEQLENFETMKHNLPMKLDGRSLVI